MRVRIAPSPTGDPHVGTAYIALFNLAFARQHGGQFVLRIEDTDQKRSTAASEQAILRSLAWCGLQWDEGPDIGGPYGPYRQSERAAIYAEHAEQLIENGRAYRCFCTAERLDAMRAAQKAAGEDWRYDGHCRDQDQQQAAARAAAGEACVVRLAMPQSGETAVPDALRGEVRYENFRVDDQILLKSDGLPTYHLANVVDDHLMQITHVIRAEEWLNSTPKHLVLYDAFGWEPPVFVHMPLLRNADRSKISKRKNPTSLEYYQRAGILPEAFLNFLGMLGFSMPDEAEFFDFDAFVAALDFGRISLGGPVFDLDRLQHINGLWIRAMAPDRLAARVAAYFAEDGRSTEVAALVAERIGSLGDWPHHAAPFYGPGVLAGPETRYLLVGCGSKKKKAVRLSAKASRAFFEDLIARLEGLPEFTAEPIEAALREAVSAAGAGVGDGFMAVRVAITGRTAAPGLYETIAAMGRALALVRLRAAAAWLAQPASAQAEIDALERDLQAYRDALGHAAEAEGASA
ncbi:MAG: glutamate--tRNA ligase [Deltaproteobacteria bacterium]|nr:glutamate--tRNA ligase [Deltaproteobacteria bacterium]